MVQPILVVEVAEPLGVAHKMAVMAVLELLSLVIQALHKKQLVEP
jgi:hypothetical protein